jgi:G6PDH family F420-dependent oxidoreductase
VESARLWDLPASPVPVAIAVSGDRSIERFAPLADHLIAVEPDAELVQGWADHREADGLPPSRTIGQIPICWGLDRQAAMETAHNQFRWFAGGWSVNADLPTTAGFAGASQFVRPQDVAEQIPCGPDVQPILDAVSAYWKAGFTHVALVQVGAASQGEFLRFAESELLPALRGAAPGEG